MTVDSLRVRFQSGTRHVLPDVPAPAGGADTGGADAGKADAGEVR